LFLILAVIATLRILLVLDDSIALVKSLMSITHREYIHETLSFMPTVLHEHMTDILVST
jgi:hypothetical protein